MWMTRRWGTTSDVGATAESNVVAVVSGYAREKHDHIVVLSCSPATSTCPGPRTAARREAPYRQLGSQICMFHVACEIGMPVSTGNSHTKFVITTAR
jgi:hypothetical protein